VEYRCNKRSTSGNPTIVYYVAIAVYVFCVLQVLSPR